MPRLVRTPDINELRSLCVAADSGTLGRAALRLGISQPALTKRLQGLEQLAGQQLLERSPRGVSLTPAGRRIYEEAGPLLAGAERVEELLAGMRRQAAPLRLAASHSSCEAFVTAVLAAVSEERGPAVELVAANSQVVRGLVGDGRADLGVAARRPGATPNPAVREVEIADDEIVCGVPPAHPWSRRARIPQADFLRTPMIVRDPASNARWTVDAELRRRGLTAAAPLAEVATPAAAKREALERSAPVLLSRRVLYEPHWSTPPVEGLAFPRSFVLVLPAAGSPSEDVQALMERIRQAVA
ncbi:MAG TPA: LysR family transcriptional regulator [Solirubrobacteraceae bacterium]|nr:LysR family transcriptional regulator [Solirubrobacteraceae bacterium]